MADWKSKIREVEFNDSLRAAANTGVDNMVIDDLACIEQVVSDGCSVKVKFVEFFDCYTFSMTYGKDHGQLKGITVWFYYPQIDKGLRLLVWLKGMIADEGISVVGNGSKSEDW